MRGRALSRSKSRKNFQGNAGSHRFNSASYVMRGGIRL